MPMTAIQNDELLALDSGRPFIVTQRECGAAGDVFGVIAFVRTVTSPAPAFTSSVPLLVTFPPEFPDRPPDVRIERGALFHPNFTGEGRWASGGMEEGETPGGHMLRLIRALQYKEIDPRRPANRNAMAWYNRRRDSGLFPTDPINRTIKPRITILRINEAAAAQPGGDGRDLS